MELNDKELIEGLEKLNALYKYTKWKPTEARKELIDIFGHTIKKNEVYYKREGGIA